MFTVCRCRIACGYDYWCDESLYKYCKLRDTLEDGRTKINQGDLDLALLYAAFYGKLDCIILLLEHGADVNTVDASYNNALMLAVINGGNCQGNASSDQHQKNTFTDVIKALVQHGCSPNVINIFNKTALIAACEFGHTDMVEALLGCLKLKQSDMATPFKSEEMPLYSTRPSLWSESLGNLHNRSTPLITAIDRGYVRLVKLLLEAYVPVDERDYGKSTALYHAAQNNNIEIMELLIASGADVNADNDADISPLWQACRWKNEEAVLLLLKHGANIARPKKSGCVTMRWPFTCVICEAARFASKDVMGALCEKWNEHEDDICLSTPIWDAVISHNIEAARCLITYGCSLDTPGKERIIGCQIGTLLDQALKHKDPKFLRLLYSAGAFTYKTLNKCYTDEKRNPQFVDSPMIAEFLETFACNPQRLKHLCRKVVREVIQKPMSHAVPKLCLPAPIKSFLLYSDIE